MACNTRHLKIDEFNVDPSNQFQTGERWMSWKKRFERQLRYFEIEDVQKKIDALLIYGGKEIEDIEENNPDPDAVEDEDAYGRLIRKLELVFLPEQNTTLATHKFRSQTQKKDENISTYATRLRKIATYCDFNDDDRMIRDQIVQTMRNRSLKIKAMSKNWNLNDLLKYAKAEEEAVTSANLIENGNGNDGIEKEEDEQVNFTRMRRNKPRNRPTEGRNQIRNCTRCGGNHGINACPAWRKTCNYCGKQNHFEKVCKLKGNERSNGTARNDERNYVRSYQTGNEFEDEESLSGGEVFSVLNVRKPKRNKINAEFIGPLENGSYAIILNKESIEIMQRKIELNVGIELDEINELDAFFDENEINYDVNESIDSNESEPESKLELFSESELRAESEMSDSRENNLERAGRGKGEKSKRANDSQTEVPEEILEVCENDPGGRNERKLTRKRKKRTRRK